MMSIRLISKVVFYEALNIVAQLVLYDVHKNDFQVSFNEALTTVSQIDLYDISKFSMRSLINVF